MPDLARYPVATAWNKIMSKSCSTPTPTYIHAPLTITIITIAIISNLMLILASTKAFAGGCQHRVQLENPEPEFLLVTEKLQRIKVMRSHFSQHKKIKILRKPLISKGFMLFSVKQGLYWQIKSPLSSTTVFTKNGIFAKNNGISQRQSGQMGHFGELFSAIFSGDINTLSKHFELYFSIQTGSWCIGLIPKPGILKKVFNKITLIGHQQIEEILLEEPRGDTTVLRFADIQITPAKLSPLEEQYFEF